MRPRAGIDIDGVLYDWDARARALLESRFGVSLDERSSSYYGREEQLKKILGPASGALAWQWLFQQEAANQGLWSMGEPIPDAVEAVSRLALTHDVVLITKRPRAALHESYWWLRTVGLAPTELVFIHPDSDRGKSTVPCAWYVDDSPAVVTELERIGHKVFLFDQPWNQDCAAGRRVRSWEELLDELAGRR